MINRIVGSLLLISALSGCASVSSLPSYFGFITKFWRPAGQEAAPSARAPASPKQSEDQDDQGEDDMDHFHRYRGPQPWKL